MASLTFRALLLCAGLALPAGLGAQGYDDSTRARLMELQQAGDCAAMWQILAPALAQGEPRAAYDALMLSYGAGLTPPGPPPDIATLVRDAYVLAVHALPSEESTGREAALEFARAQEYGAEGEALVQCLESDATGATCHAQAIEAALVPSLELFAAELEARAALPGAQPARCRE